MAILDDKARELIGNVTTTNGGHQDLLDPQTIELGLNILATAIKLYKQCNQPAAAAAKEMQSPPFRARRQLRQLIREKHLPQTISPRALFDASIQLGAGLKDTEVHEMYTDPRTAG